MERPSGTTPNPAGKPRASSQEHGETPANQQPEQGVPMKTRGVSQSKSQEWNWGLGRDPGVSTNRAPEDLLRLVPPVSPAMAPLCPICPFFNPSGRGSSPSPPSLPAHRIAGVGSLHLGEFAGVGVEDVHLFHQARQGCFGGFPHLLVDFF